MYCLDPVMSKEKGERHSDFSTRILFYLLKMTLSWKAYSTSKQFLKKFAKSPLRIYSERCRVWRGEMSSVSKMIQAMHISI